MICFWHIYYVVYIIYFVMKHLSKQKLFLIPVLIINKLLLSRKRKQCRQSIKRVRKGKTWHWHPLHFSYKIKLEYVQCCQLCRYLQKWWSAINMSCIIRKFHLVLLIYFIRGYCQYFSSLWYLAVIDNLLQYLNRQFWWLIIETVYLVSLLTNLTSW